MNANLDGMTLFEALNHLETEGRSGRLHVEHWEGREGIIGLNDGKIVHCQVGRIRGMEALKVLRSWISVSLRFFENVENLSVDVEEDTREILASLETQDKEIKSIRNLIPGPQAIFALSADCPESRVSLNSKLWKVLAMVNGRNSVKDICAALRATEFSVAKILAHLNGRKIIRMVALVRPIAMQHREPFFRELEDTLANHIGPIASVLVEDALLEMGKSREYITRNDLSLLVERIGESVEEERERIEFQGHMLAVIQRIFKEG